MDHHYNAAARLYAILSRIPRVSGGISATDGWAQVLGLPGEPSQLRSSEIARLLMLMDQERLKVIDQLQQKGLWSDRYKKPLQQVLAAILIDKIGGKWDHVRNALSESAMTALGLMPDVLPQEEEPFAEEDVTAMRDYVEAELQRVATSDLARPLKQFLTAQWHNVSRALRDYPICGPSAFRQASEAMANAVVEQADILRANADKQPIQQWWSFWKRLREVDAERVKKYAAAALAVGKLAAFVLGHDLPTLGTTHDFPQLPPGPAVEAPAEHMPDVHEPDFEIAADDELESA